ncbi:MAG TPA: alpha-ribazole phosphatase [Sediminibacterium sp.]|jgi:alpha-ribazole phosphatase|uniref:alpha-ribazole phosphatase n=1 Tax=Sediminibacterium sp. TaxID=1917865 RepID=UPI0008C43D49|nr:alpha-ribazole phosphatase [Sediminibacterium sp.]OHC86060.1 MAG: alpha-ribazole phosphatase [Sphingobacteriia bacterium RIFOXYC2_FULL_35_18]OHC89575.1 MAG: alpha-ribazole phosphatase [Sphingobacteriia bacterium RIFOXYD2_FULL_35_12]HLD54552.1 alpha-ribazole phosphatase [Sediminibacterium sp.]
MEIYLIRHTTPKVEKGICYGQADLDITETFLEEVEAIKPHLPSDEIKVYSSPLQRCKKLADALFDGLAIDVHDDLMELNCGQWELLPWNDIPKEEIQPWMDDFVNVAVPKGESYVDLHNRVVKRFNEIVSKQESAVIVAHGGVLRSILSHITSTPLKESFDAFTLHYGCVVKIQVTEDSMTHELLYNYSRQGKEWHRPTV